MHADELEIDEALVRCLLAEQFPEWADLPLSRVEPAGTVNAIFRLGDSLSLRLARRKGPTEPGGRELDWLPRLAPLLPVEIPLPVAQGQAVAALAYYTPENSPVLHREAQTWLALVLSEPRNAKERDRHRAEPRGAAHLGAPRRRAGHLSPHRSARLIFMTARIVFSCSDRSHPGEKPRGRSIPASL
jgi:hypothetical protein